MECDICLNNWDSEIHIPRLLNCGHTYCNECLKNILVKSKELNKDFLCPLCNSKQNIKEEKDIEDLLKNYNLLEISDRVSLKIGKDEKTIKSLSNILSINMGENKEKTDFFEQLKKIDSILFKICIRKNEINIIDKFFDSYLAEFEKLNKKKIENVFNKINKIIEYFKNNTIQILNQCISEQKKTVKKHKEEMNSLLKELNSIEYTLMSFVNNSKSYENLSENEKYINKSEKRVNNFINYHLDLNLLSLDIGVNSNCKSKLFASLQSFIRANVSFFEINKKPPVIKQILNNEGNWPCICDELKNDAKNAKCTSCGLFRRFETFENNSDKINEDEYEEIFSKNKNIIRQIKEEESKEFLHLINSTKINKFYCLSLDWFDSFKNYLQNIKCCSPGPINNSKLLEYNTDTKKLEIKQMLIRNKDYIIINEKLWQFFYLNFNGGPLIEVNDDKQLKLVDNYKKIETNNLQSYSSLKKLFFEEEPTEYDESILEETINNSCEILDNIELDENYEININHNTPNDDKASFNKKSKVYNKSINYFEKDSIRKISFSKPKEIKNIKESNQLLIQKFKEKSPQKLKLFLHKNLNNFRYFNNNKK